MGADVSACIDMFGAGSESGLMRYARVRIR
jgi:hypothetical protein